MSSLDDIIDQYGDDPEAALDAFANYDPQAWSAFVDRAARAEYKRRCARRRNARMVEFRPRKQQRKLFQVDETEAIHFREIVVIPDGSTETPLMELAGSEGARKLREVAERDEAPARTTLIRANQYRALADEVERQSARLGRPVSVADVLGIAA